MDKGHWEYPQDFDINEWTGFIYRIVDIQAAREYIGKKSFHSTAGTRSGSRKAKHPIKTESDWKTYTSSCKELNDRIAKLGKQHFLFLIESLHESKGSLAYAEVQKQVSEDVLRAMLPGTKTHKYYNRYIAPIKFTPPATTEKEQQYKVSWGNA